MFHNSHELEVVDVIVVARDQAQRLPATLAGVPRRLVRSIVVVDNGSRDATPALAGDAGAVVLRETEGGYGAALQRALAHLASLPKPPDAVVLLAADGSDDPAEIARLLEPMRTDNAEFVVGVRAGQRLPPLQRVTRGLIAAVYRHRFSDLGPYRAVRFPALVALALRDRGSGILVEMLVKALAMGVHVAEIPVHSAAEAGEHARLRAERARLSTRARATLERSGRSLYHILRNATAR
ncbi:glycosyltransferase family 2 protein [Haliangium ochraceum]|uniref:Glycosyl transferase family 2 n=1 Tax=Haliangium ochraceum (strain DSM 14365 / JCM 11303 / SMP-2) TaxID=502025 RepID=D0LYA8_HALO1|nr:glycosyltransferase family 2 protein [Haliangium ochraceum]ACY16258.1 glycosyl transferase family 2 [Haliangium ochraceum DSM 14365]